MAQLARREGVVPRSSAALRRAAACDGSVRAGIAWTVHSRDFGVCEFSKSDPGYTLAVR